jgi:type IX secretion system PorP/SprF family membrane protein
MTGANDAIVGSLIYNQQDAFNFPGAPKTVLAQVNSKLGYTNSSLGGGVSFQEYGVLKDYSFFMSYSYSVTLKKQRRLMFGTGFGFSVLQENGSSLTTTLDGDGIYKLNTTAYELNMSLGAAYMSKNFWIGVSIPKLIHNAYDYEDLKNTYSIEPFNFNLMAGYNLSLNHQFLFMPSFMIRSDHEDRFNADLNANFKYKDIFWFGPYYRINAAYGFTLGVRLGKYLYLSYAVEIQQTAFSSGSYGNHEIMLGFKLPRSNRAIGQSPRYF